MDELSKEEFIEFLESYKSNKRYYDVTTEVSKSNKGNPLIFHDFKMYCLDNMKDDCKRLKNNPPKSTDGLYYKETDDKFVLYLVEFKGSDFTKENHKLRLKALIRDIDNRNESNKNGKKCFTSGMLHDLKEISKKYEDKVEVGLNLKPIESIFITIPEIYKEYCQINNLEYKDIKKFLQDCEKRLFVFAIDYFEVEKKEEAPTKSKSMNLTKRVYASKNKSIRRGNENKSRDYSKSLGSNLNKYYNKLKKGKIIDDYKIKNKNQFTSFLQEEHLIGFENN